MPPEQLAVDTYNDNTAIYNDKLHLQNSLQQQRYNNNVTITTLQQQRYKNNVTTTTLQQQC